MRDSNRCVGDSNRLSEIWILCHQGFESLCKGFESPEWDLNFAIRGIRIRNSKIRIALFWPSVFCLYFCQRIRIRNSKIWIALWPSAFTFAKGFESVTRRFKSPSLVLHNSSFRDSNCCVGDSNPYFSSLFMFFVRDSNRCIGIQIGGSQLLFFLHMGFESLD